MKLSGRIALLVGCSPNINAAIAVGLAAEGARIVCFDISQKFAEACADEIRAAGGEAIAVVGDATKEEDVLAAVAKAKEVYGGIDILINGAVIQIRKGLLTMSVEEFRRQIEVILTASFLFTKHVAALMISQGRKGNVINILSTEAHQGNPGNIGYASGKGGIVNFTRSAAMELAPHGIRVNSLTPTATAPEESAERIKAWGVAWSEPQLGDRREFTKGDQGVPLGKRPSPSHYAKGAVFLASDDAEMITGFDLRVDGGTISRYWRWNPGATIEG